jgi:hypothetical protein
MKTTTSTLLRDVIELQPLRLVMHLADVDIPESEAAREVLETFVATREVSAALGALVDALARPTGLGTFIKGHYGSGKSHFLAFLSLLLHPQPSIAQAAATRVGVEAPPGDFLVVRVALQEYSGHIALEDIVMEAVEKALEARLGRREVLSDSRFLLENFNALLLDRHPDFLAEQACDRAAWLERAERNPLEAARRVAAFLSALPQNPLRARADRKRGFDRLFELLPEGAGVVILLDELSEFLKSRPNVRSFNDDLRWLQFVGEASERRPLWGVATMQEAIEDIGYEDQALVQRIKDRFRLRFSLSAHHVEELIEGRLVRKKADAEKTVRAAWTALSDAFPDMALTPEHFSRIYPVHPATLSMLENLMGLFSQHRGVVDFVHRQLAGDPAHGIAPFLDQPADRLLSCDMIFDHFKERIRESVDTSAYVNVAWAFLEKDIARLFDKPRDRELATRCVKIMILVELSPLERPRTVRQLATLVALRVSRIDPSSNFIHLKEKILDRLVDESSYVRRTPAPEAGDTVYDISLEANAGQMVEARTRALMRGMDVGPELWFRILRTVDVPWLPLAELCSVGAVPKSFRWQNTTRYGRITVGDVQDCTPESFKSALSSLEGSEDDWSLYIGMPFGVERQEQVARRLFEYAAASRFAPLFAVWLPRQPSDSDLESCQRVLAQAMLAEQLRGEGEAARPLAEVVRGLLDTGNSRLREIVVDAYYGGTFIHADGTVVPATDVARSTLDRLLPSIFGDALERVYDRHKQIRPLVEECRKETLVTLWTRAVVPGQISTQDAAAAGLDRILDGVGMPLGLFRRHGKEYVLAADPARHPVLGEILRGILPGQTVSIHALYWKLRKGRWGILKPFFMLACGGLVQLGHCSAWRDGRPIALDSLRKLLDGGVDALGEGRILEPADRDRLGELAFLGVEPPAKSFSLPLQRELWQKVVEGMGRLGAQVDGLRATLRRVEGFASLAVLPMDEVSEALSAADRIVRSVNPSLDSRDGLEAVLRAVTPESGAVAARVSTWHRFFTEQFDAFLQMHRTWTTRPGRVDESLQPAFERWGEAFAGVGRAIEEARFEELWETFFEFREQYVEYYVRAHDAFHADPRIGEWQRIGGSAEMRLLDRLSGLYGVEVEDDAVALRRALAAAPRPCRAATREGLRGGWACDCGFDPTAPPAIADPGPVQARAAKGVRAYGAALRSPQKRERLQTHAATLEAVGRKQEAERIARLCAEDIAEEPFAVLTWLSDGLTQEINQALQGRVVLVERSVEALVSMLAGRVLSPAAIRQAVERWMGTVDPKAFVRVTAAEAAAGDDARERLLRRAEAERRSREVEGEDAVAYLEGEREHKDLAALVAERLVKQVVGQAPDSRVLRGWAARLRKGGASVQAAADVLELVALLDEGGSGDVVDEYRDRVSRIPLVLDTLQHRLFEGGSLPGWMVDELAARARRSVDGHAVRFELAGGGVEMARVVPEIVEPLLRDHGACVLLIVDAMRWDLFGCFEDAIASCLPRHRLQRVHAVRAVVPTRTAENRAALLKEIDCVRVTSADRVDRRAEVEAVMSRPEGLSVVHFLFVDERLHDSSLPLHTLYRELRLELESLVLPQLRHVPEDVPVVVIADHGFVYTPGGTPTYTHGGASAFERLVPCAVWVPADFGMRSRG